MSDCETLERFEGKGNPAVGTSVISFNDGDPNVELIGFDYYETEENSITWVWDDPVISNNVVIPLHRIKRVDTRFEAIGKNNE